MAKEKEKEKKVQKLDDRAWFEEVKKMFEEKSDGRIRPKPTQG